MGSRGTKSPQDSSACWTKTRPPPEIWTSQGDFRVMKGIFPEALTPPGRVPHPRKHTRLAGVRNPAEA